MQRWKALVGITAVSLTTLLGANHASAASSQCTVWAENGDDPPEVGVLNDTVTVPENVPPQLDLTSETMTVKNGTLIVDIHVVDMEEQVPPGYQGMRWVTDWSYGGTTYWATAEYSTISGTSFFVGGYGEVGGPPAQSPVDVTGTIVTGPDGYAEIDVPLATVGSPPAGSTLAQPVGDDMEMLLDGSVAGQQDQTGVTVDYYGPQHDYVVGRGCA